jgi:hypothetical protein
MSQVSEQIKNIIDANKSNFIELNLDKMYLDASDKYNELIKLGLIKPRGNNLLSKEKTFNSCLRFNK